MNKFHLVEAYKNKSKSEIIQTSQAFQKKIDKYLNMEIGN